MPLDGERESRESGYQMLCLVASFQKAEALRNQVYFLNLQVHNAQEDYLKTEVKLCKWNSSINSDEYYNPSFLRLGYHHKGVQ